MSKFLWKWDDTTEFLRPRDAYICFRFIDNIAKANLLEIGVWKGGWIFSMLGNCPKSKAIGIDPYPAKGIKQKFLEEVSARRFDSRVELYETPSEVEENISGKFFDFVHIDGEHTESAVNEDLKFALKHLKPNGVIAVDDIFHRNFPGIASAVFNFISRNSVSSFLITPGKIYICREEYYDSFYSFTRQILQEAEIDYETDFMDENSPEGYFQTNAIKGFRQILIPEGQTQSAKLRKKLGIEKAPESLQLKLKRIIRLLVPEIFKIAVRRILLRLKTGEN
jgi:hypothetical protein